MISFVICAIISTSCGTSSGSITAMAPVMLPLAVGMGCSPGLVCGAIISGAIFGDNLAPISGYHHWFGLDTGSAGGRCGQNEAALFSHSRRNFSCSLCCAGQCDDGKPRHGRRCHRSRFKVSSSSGSASDYDYHDQKGFDLVATLLVCDAMGIVLNLVLGTINLDAMLSNEGPIVAGLSGMINLVMYCILLFILLKSSIAAAPLTHWCKG